MKVHHSRRKSSKCILVHITRLENKTQVKQLLDPCMRNIGCFPCFEQFKLAALALYPNCQLLILGIFLGDIAMPVRFTKLLQLLIPLFPYSRMRIPNETQRLQEPLAFIRHGGVLSFNFQTILVSLAFYPVEQGFISGPIERDVAMSKLFVKLSEFLEPLIPLFWVWEASL